MDKIENPGGKDQGIQETGVESLSQCDTIQAKNQVDFDADPLINCFKAALYYAEKGKPVFPCNPSNKRPMTPHGFKDASTDPAVIKAWWEYCPDAAIGIPTGEISGLVVVDIDDYKADFDQVAWDAICEEIGGLPETLTQRTGGGGLQYIFQHPGGRVPSKNGVITGVDFKADGGYVIVPPSGHPSGGNYEWINMVNPAPLPAGLVDAIHGGKKAPESPQPPLNEKKPVVEGMFEEEIKKAIIGTSPDADGEVRIACQNPDCVGSQKDTLSVNVTKGVYHCFRCSLKGNYLKVNGTGKKPLAEFLYKQASLLTDHPYIELKQIKPPDIRVDQHVNWVVPFTDQSGQIQTVQYIDPDGKKRFLSKAKNNGQGSSGAAYRIDGTTDTAYVCEGAATGHSIHEASGCTVYCVGGKENFKHVLPWVKTMHQTVIVAADNDTNGHGLKAARKAAQENNLKVACPVTTGQDFNDMAIDDGLNAVKDVLEHPVDPGPDAGNISQWDDPMDLDKAIHQTPDPMPWLMSERVPKGRGIILTGLGGSSKTRCLYSFACGCVLGFLSWDWKVEITGKAVLVLTEDTAQDVHRTIHYMTLDLDDFQKQTLADNLIIYPLAGKDTRLMVKSSKGTVKESPLFQSLKEKIIALGDVAFVGLDPALSVSEGNELDQGHQRALGKMADDLAVQTGATVCLVAHATKGSLHTQELSSHNSRGGGAITDAVRGEYSMRNMTIEEANKAEITDVEERKRHVQLVCTKGNAIPPAAFVPVWLRRDDFGNLAEVDIQMNGKGTITDRDIEILKVHSEIGASCPPKLADWRTECIKRGLITGKTENAEKQAMKRVLDKLKKAGLIEQGGVKGVWVQTQGTP